MHVRIARTDSPKPETPKTESTKTEPKTEAKADPNPKANPFGFDPMKPFGFDPSLAPAGKSALKVVMATSFRRWQELAGEPQRYAEEKQRIAETVIGLLEPRFPGLRGQIEVVDVATADFDLDGRLDLANVTLFGQSYILSSRRIGKPWQSIQMLTAERVHRVTAGDFTGDGLLDPGLAAVDQRSDAAAIVGLGDVTDQERPGISLGSFPHQEDPSA